MRKHSYLFISVSCVSLLGATTALSSEQSTKILQDYIGFYQTGTDQLNVGEKNDSAKATEWKNITLKSADGNYQVVIPWMKVEEKLLGGFELTTAPKTAITITPKDLAPVNMVLQSSNMLTEVGGSDEARTFDTTFDQATVSTQENSVLKISAKFTGGTSSLTIFGGENKHNTGTASLSGLTGDYGFSKDATVIKSTFAFKDIHSKFEAPSFADFDVQNPQRFLDPSRNMVLSYSVASGNSSSKMASPKGQMDFKTSFGAGAATIGIVDGIATLKGESAEVKYTIKSSSMGMVPMGITADKAVTNLTVPLDNVAQAKPANLKLSLSGFNVSDQVWAMFDPGTVLPHDNAELDIDVSGNLRWLSKLKDLDAKSMGKAPPVQVEDVKINALNLKIVGAEIQTSGAFTLDNALFPPLPDGSVNISLSGADTLLQKLAINKMVPGQYLAMAMGMKGMLFDTAPEGGDHLVTLIKVTKDGHVTANGVLLK